jgi:iron complex transport system ATP-binding protein
MSALLAVERVSARLGKTRALRDVSLSIAPGDVVALLGPNGAGKTTLLRVALGFVAPEAGAASLGGDDPLKLSAKARALRAAYMPQKPGATWPVSVEALVALGRFAHGGAPGRVGAADTQAVDDAIAACGLRELRTRRIDEISGGERTRAHLARTLAQGAPLLLLDEPTAGLDPAQALGAADILRRHTERGGAVLFSTHDIALAASIAHRVVLMHAGECIGSGAPSDVLTPEKLRLAYGRAGRLEDVGGGFAAVFT